jgi:hypothetical protein
LATGNQVKVPMAQPLDRRHGVMSERPIRCAKMHDNGYGIDRPLTKLEPGGASRQALDGLSLPVRDRQDPRANNRICKCAAESVSVEPATSPMRLSPSRARTVP